MQHMYCNFKKVHSSKVLKDLLWKIPKSTNELLHKAAFKDLEEYDKDAFNCIMNGPHPKQWCRAYFSDWAKSDILCNNIVSLSILLS